jgi:hypothetical protein
MVRYLLALLALIPSLAAAQTLTFPPDAGTYVSVPATYASGSTQNVLGDGSNAKGGTAPAFTTYPEGPDLTDKSLGAWATAGNIVTDNSYCTVVAANLAPCPEKKLRLQFTTSVVLYDDPIKYYGQPGVSHCHEFFGKIKASALSTRKSLRKPGPTTGYGGTAWSTLYWFPCWEKTVGGKLYAMPAIRSTVYYQRNGTNPMVDDLQQLHEKVRFILGTNMGDPMDCGVKNEINLANGGPGTGCNPVVNAGSDRYTYVGNGFDGYQCTSPDGSTIRALKAGYTSAPGFKLNDGTDPWEGRCVDGDNIYAQARAPYCWDGVNLSAPDGMAHFRQEIGDNLYPVTGLTCPNGWYRVPQFEEKASHPTHGWSDYSTWVLSSDAMANAKCTALGQTCPTNPGWSFHADWMNGISKTIRDQAFGFCLGIGTNAPHQCNVGSLGATISATTSLANPPVSSRTFDTNDPTKMFLIETTRTASHPMKGM